jgi:branched-chain amino acid aminotransferase
MIVFLNGEFIDKEDAKVSVTDRGFLYGDGVFETLRAYGGYIFKLERHLQRLTRGLQILGIENRTSIEDYKETLYRVLEINNLSDAYLRITVSRGRCKRGPRPVGCEAPTVFIEATSYEGFPEEIYKQGVDLSVAKRKNWRSEEDADLKSLSFLPNILARMESEDIYFDCIMLNREGYITECSVSNIFFVKDGILCTPSRASGILDGITRQVVIELARERGIETRESLYTLQDLKESEEVFITNTLIEIIPVRRVNEWEFRPGKITSLLLEAFRKLVTEERNSDRNPSV